MASVEIQGIICTYRDKEFGEDVLYENLPQEEQYFRRIEYPFTEGEIEAMITKEHRNSDAQQKWVDREKKRITYKNGVYARISGNLTYIPASYWCYLNHWILEHGEHPEYREADRIFFLFMEYLYFETKVYGLTRGKGRRQGASSLGYFFMWWVCGRMPEKVGGSISFNDDAAQENFQKMFMRGFKALLPCFVEPFDSNSDNFVRFVEPEEKAKKGVNRKRKGLNSYCGYLPNSINSYDSGRLSFGLFDETGKYHKMNINTYWSKVTPTLKKGTKKLGFAYMPTTVNPKKQGGENYKQFWREADQNRINQATGKPYGLNTPHGVVRYFVPATEGYSGCIDKFGNSIVDDPEEPIMGNDGEWITEGARTIILRERSMKEGEQLLEHKRDFPLDEYDMFAFEFGVCEFVEANFLKQIKLLEENPALAYWRRIRIWEEWIDVRERGDVEAKKKRVVRWADDPKGDCWMKEEPNTENLFSETASRIEPLNTISYSAGADTYKNIFAVQGSDGAIIVFKKSNIVAGVEMGLYPVFVFVGRPRLIKQFNYIAFLICLWYGCRMNFEIDAGTWFYEDFAEMNALRLLEWEPARDPLRRDKIIKPGTESAQPFQLAKQLEVAKLYYDGTSKDHYNGNVHRVTYLPLLRDSLAYNHSERTPSHLTVAFMMALLPCLSSPAPQRPTSRLEKPLISPRKVVLPH